MEAAATHKEGQRLDEFEIGGSAGIAPEYPEVTPRATGNRKFKAVAVQSRRSSGAVQT